VELKLKLKPSALKLISPQNDYLTSSSAGVEVIRKAMKDF
jgi:hypothetical protein